MYSHTATFVIISQLPLQQQQQQQQTLLKKWTSFSEVSSSLSLSIIFFPWVFFCQQKNWFRRLWSTNLTAKFKSSRAFEKSQICRDFFVNIKMSGLTTTTTSKKSKPKYHFFRSKGKANLWSPIGPFFKGLKSFSLYVFPCEGLCFSPRFGWY